MDEPNVEDSFIPPEGTTPAPEKLINDFPVMELDTYAHARIDALQENTSMIIAQIMLPPEKEQYEGQLVTLATQILGTIREGDKIVRTTLGIPEE